MIITKKENFIKQKKKQKKKYKIIIKRLQNLIIICNNK